MLETMKSFRQNADVMVALEKYGIVEKSALSGLRRGEEIQAPQKVMAIA